MLSLCMGFMFKLMDLYQHYHVSLRKKFQYQLFGNNVEEIFDSNLEYDVWDR